MTCSIIIYSWPFPIMITTLEPSYINLLNQIESYLFNNRNYHSRILMSEHDSV